MMDESPSTPLPREKFVIIANDSAKKFATQHKENLVFHELQQAMGLTSLTIVTTENLTNLENSFSKHIVIIDLGNKQSSLLNADFINALKMQIKNKAKVIFTIYSDATDLDDKKLPNLIEHFQKKNIYSEIYFYTSKTLISTISRQPTTPLPKVFNKTKKGEITSRFTLSIYTPKPNNENTVDEDALRNLTF